MIINYALDDLDIIKRTVKFCNQFAEDVNATCKHRNITVDAKSMVGMMALVGQIIVLEIISENEDVRKRFEEGLLGL